MVESARSLCQSPRVPKPLRSPAENASRLAKDAKLEIRSEAIRGAPSNIAEHDAERYWLPPLP